MFKVADGKYNGDTDLLPPIKTLEALGYYKPFKLDNWLSEHNSRWHQSKARQHYFRLKTCYHLMRGRSVLHHVGIAHRHGKNYVFVQSDRPVLSDSYFFGPTQIHGVTR